MTYELIKVEPEGHVMTAARRARHRLVHERPTATGVHQ